MKSIPPLLHDARLIDCRWDSPLKTLELCFQCLRRNIDGTSLENSVVELKLAGVERVVAYYSPARVEVRPSEFAPIFRLTLSDFESWEHGAVEAQLAINSPGAEFDLATACIQESLVGVFDGRPSESSLRVHVSFSPHNYGPEGTAMGLSIECDSLEPFANSVPLDIELWEQQFKAWWTGWRQHWAANGEPDDEDRCSTQEDRFIPAGSSDPPDLSYCPPKEVPYMVSPSTAPAELLEPISEFHAGLHERNWQKVASAYPDFDLGSDDRAARLREQYLGWDYGRWVYVRKICTWWCEGNRACVVVRGIEHTKGDDESPASNEETEIAYGLRKSAQTWVISTWSQGWPRYGSAEKLHSTETWRDGWNLAD